MTAARLAWHGYPALKADAVAQMTTHRAEDSIVQSVYQELDPELGTGFRGCFLGCLAPLQRSGNPGWRQLAERLYGIPIRVAGLLEDVFEGVEPEDCADFAVHAVDAIPVGADLAHLPTAVALDVLTDPGHGVGRLVAEGSPTRGAVDAAAELLRRQLAGEPVAGDDWEDAQGDIDRVITSSHSDGPTVACVGTAAFHAAYPPGRLDMHEVLLAWCSAHDTPEHRLRRRGDWLWLAGRVVHHLGVSAAVPTECGG